MMHINLCPDAASLGLHAALETADIIRKSIDEYGCARIVLSTGASQFTTLEALVNQPRIDWNKVEMFHLDEYIGLPDTHLASFRKYLRERFVNKTNVGKVHFVDGTETGIRELTVELNRAPVHVGLIGIGQNAHIAFNDPPADFDTNDAYIIVNLNDTCKAQQVHEGWFKTVNDVPKQAVSMSVRQIMKCDRIISAVPYLEKADAVMRTLQNGLNSLTPATMLKTHRCFSLYVDHDSFSKTDFSKIIPAKGTHSFEMTVYTE